MFKTSLTCCSRTDHTGILSADGQISPVGSEHWVSSVCSRIRDQNYRGNHRSQKEFSELLIFLMPIFSSDTPFQRDLFSNTRFFFNKLLVLELKRHLRIVLKDNSLQRSLSNYELKYNYSKQPAELKKKNKKVKHYFLFYFLSQWFIFSRLIVSNLL